MGEKITLIKAALTNVLVYYMSIFNMLVKVADKIEKLQRSFLWEGSEDEKDHLIKWDEACKPKKVGVLVSEALF